jgi:hypothetical protein
MCEYSVSAKATRPAVVGEDLPYVQLAFRDPANANCAVCLPVGTELKLSRDVRMIAWTIRDNEYLGKHREVSGHLAKMLSLDFRGYRRDVIQFPGMSENEYCFLKELGADSAGPIRGSVLQLPAPPIVVKETPWTDSRNATSPAIAAYHKPRSETPAMRVARHVETVLTLALCIGAVVTTFAIIT